MNLHAAAAYARHLLTARSTAGHGVHSPFMFSFITEVIGGRSDRAIQREVEGLRREMLADRRVVMVRDLGAGSVVMRDRNPGAESAVMREREPGAGSVVMKERGKSARQEGPGSDEDIGRLRDDLMVGGELSLQQGVSDNVDYQVIRQDTQMQVRERRIRDIAAAAAVPKREAALLARIAGSLENIRIEGLYGGQAPVDGYHSRRAEVNSGRASGEETNSGPASGEETNSGPASGAETNSGSASGAENEGGHAPVTGQGGDDRPVILELGTSLGIGTLALALGAPQRRVISIEGCPALAAIARENLQRHSAINTEVLCMDFGEALALLRKRGTKVALAFIDGNHRGAALTEYVNTIREMGEEMIIIADDIHMNSDMIRAWQSLSAGKFAPASLETFRMGMLFCLRNLTPGHYKVR